MHHKVKLLLMEFSSVQELVGMLGSQIFNNKEKIVGMIFASRYGSIYGLSSTALDVMLTSYKVKTKKKKKKKIKRRKSQRGERLDPGMKS
ncbi:hypothetical protein QL285_025017 [Trifolium repens]|nr:hypothetical protein QL285_025017 [Trifolium repens]